MSVEAAVDAGDTSAGKLPGNSEAAPAAEKPDIQTQLDSHAAAQPTLSQAFNAPKDPPALSDGETRVKALKDAGFGDDDVNSWKADAHAALVQGGASEDDINKYWGIKSNPDMKPLGDYFKGNVDSYFKANADDGPINANGQPKKQREAKSYVEALSAGFQTSVSGLENKPPEIVLGDHAERGMKIAQMIGQFAGDWPYMETGAAMGAAAGGAAGAAAVPFIGGPVGALVGGAAGGFAVPQAMRKYLMDSYQKGEVKTAGEFAERAQGVAWEAIKGGVTGVLTAGVGRIAGEFGSEAAGQVTAGASDNVANLAIRGVGTVAQTTSEVATMVSVANAFEGKMPDWDDLINTALMVGGLHATTSVLPKLAAIYANTGARPEEVAQRMNNDVIYKQGVLSGNPDLPLEAQPTNHRGEPIPAEKPIELKAGSEAEGGSIPESKDSGRTPEVNEILSKIGANEKVEPFGQSTTRANFIDYTDNIKVALEAARAKGAEISPEQDAYILSRLLAGSGDVIRQTLEYGVANPVTGEAVPGNEGFNQIMRDLPEGPDGKPDKAGLAAYAIAKRSLELSTRGITPYEGFDGELAEKVVEQGQDKFEAINERRIKAENDVLDWAVKKGAFSEKQAADIKRLNEAHIPFARVQDADYYTGGKSARGDSLMRKIFGSDKQILDPIAQQALNMGALIKRVLVNEVRSTFLDNMTAGGLVDHTGRSNGDGFYLRRSVEQPSASAAKALASELAKRGANIDPESVKVISEKSGLRDDQIAIIRDGKRVVYEGAPGVIQTLKMLEGNKVATDSWTKFLKAFAHLERIGVVGANLAFPFKHIMRGGSLAGVYTKTANLSEGSVPFISTFAAEVLSSPEFFKNGAMVREWVANGGSSNLGAHLENTYIRDNRLGEADEKAPFMGKFWNTVKTPLQFSETAIKMSDGMTRYTEYKRLREGGTGPREAAFRSREIVEDYNKYGLTQGAFQLIRASTAFFGAHVNALDTFYQQAAADPKGITSKLALLSAASAALWWVNKDDDAIKAKGAAQRDLNWQINLTRLSGGGMNNGKPAVIQNFPKPWAPGVFFGSGIEHVLESMFQNNPKADHWEHFGHSLMESVVPHPMPNLLQPMYEQATNRSSFTGMDLVPEDRQRLLPELKYKPYTTESAKLIAKLIGYVPLVRDIGPTKDPLASPAIVENYVHGWTGQLGMSVLQAGDYALEKLGKTPPQAERSTTIAQKWFLNQFLMRFPDGREQDIQDFYDNKERTDEVLNSIKFKKQTPEQAAAIAKAHPDLQFNLDGIGKGIAAARKAIENAQAAPMDPVEKRQQIDTLLFQIFSMAKMGNQQMAEFQKAREASQKKPGGS